MVICPSHRLICRVRKTCYPNRCRVIVRTVDRGFQQAIVEKTAVRNGGIMVFVNDASEYKTGAVVAWPPGERHRPSFHVRSSQLVPLKSRGA